MQATLERLRQRREERGDEGGFTLIELLIVIVILGILAAIVVFAVQNLTGSSAQSTCRSDYKTVETATEAYNAQVGHYPAATDNFNTSLAPGAPAYAAPVTEPAADLINALMVPQKGANGGTVGPWLRDFPANGSHYQMALFAASPSTESVYNTAAAPAQIPAAAATNTIADCGSVG